MIDIFLSYNREDKVLAKHFADGFKSQGFEVWWDTTLRAGEAYDEVTETALRRAKAVVVLWSVKSVASRWVRAEALLAHRNKTLVPCMIEPCERPIMFELTQSAELFGWKGNRSDPRWVAFVNDVRTHIEKNQSIQLDTQPLASLVSAPPRQGLNKRGLMFAGIGAAIGGAIGAAGLGVWGIAKLGNGQSSTNQGANSVAVLPFINISGDEGQSYFADGLSAEIRAELAGNSLLRVAAQTSSAVFKIRAANAQTMAKQLGVAFLLDGNVRKAAGTARVNTELIDGKTGISMWAQTFDRPLDDIFAVQSEIAEAVVAALVAKLPAQSAPKSPSGDTKKMAVGGTTNLAAYENYLRGRALYEAALSAETDRQCLAAYESAIALDPNYAAAHAGRASALSVIANQSGDVDLIRSYHRNALAAAQNAVDLAPTFATAHSVLGFVQFTNGLDARAAKPSFDKSIQYGAGDGDVVTGFAMFCGRTGRQEEASATIKKAIDLDPLNPTVFRCSGQIAAMGRQHDDAIKFYQRALSMNPQSSVTQFLIGMSHYLSGRTNEARAAFTGEPNKLFGLAGMAIIEKKQGNIGAGQAALTKLIAEFGDGSLYQQAQIHAAWGDQAKAISTLERAYIVGDSGLSSLLTDPIFDAIRQQTRFLQLLKTIGFE